MEGRLLQSLVLLWVLLPLCIRSQSNFEQSDQEAITYLFEGQEVQSIKLSYKSKDLAEKSNDSTYVNAELHYRTSENIWKLLPAEVRVRGGFRKSFCYFTPLKMKIDKEDAHGSPFEKDRKMKLVLPCLKSKSADDNLIKEYMAYKIYETLSTYHFKTRLLEVELNQIKKGKTDQYMLMGFAIQDDESFAESHNGKEIERFIDYNAQDEKYRVINALFQYMIGNTDFSTVYLHNEKLFYIDDMIVPVPYDFDMSGLVDASYAVVSQVRNEVLPITEVTNRLYRGFEADETTLQTVRSEFIAKEEAVFQSIDSLKTYFSDLREFESSRKFIAGFYEVLHDDKKFRKRIIDKSRKK